MKRQFSYTICAAAMLLAACAKDDATHPAPDTRAQLTIAVIDRGYVPTDGMRPVASNTASGSETGAGAPATRAAEKGYATEFTAGDLCGLYIVRDGAVTVANAKLTASAGQNAGIVWTPDASAGTLWYTPGDRYFVYYPWQAAPQDAPAAGQTLDAADDAADDAAFFAELIAAWKPAADQSVYAAGYTASDLMTAEASVGVSAAGSISLVFEMTHRMALAVVELPGTVNLDGGIVSVEAEFSSGAQPCRMADHTYRYLVHPAAKFNPTLEGTFDNGTLRGFSIDPAGIAGGRYKTYKVDGGIISEKEVQVGDFFYSDGSYSTKLNPNKKVIGIVFQTDPKRIGEAEKEALKANGVTAPRGLVMAVKNAGTNLAWGPAGARENLVNCESPEQLDNNISGYGNCRNIRQTYGNLDRHPAFKAADEYNKTCPAPGVTTGWYLPAAGQWYDILRNLGGLSSWSAAHSMVGDHSWYQQGDVCLALNKWLSDVTEADKFNFSNEFWSSSQYSNENARHWGINSNGNVTCFWNSKSNEYSVRPVLAF